MISTTIAGKQGLAQILVFCQLSNRVGGNQLGDMRIFLSCYVPTCFRTSNIHHFFHHSNEKTKNLVICDNQILIYLIPNFMKIRSSFDYLIASAAAMEVSLCISSLMAMSQKLLWVQVWSLLDPELDKYSSAIITLWVWACRTTISCLRRALCRYNSNGFLGNYFN